ncbi:FAD-binding protein [candidate division TA06 bacterium DG_26]|uniref:FAD-binding protein n=1 Tax=candidate division TA06 bacterium DG_26 TaxID=1703771 RepID=A0A0S7WIC1_UNCT6|nr:MAG: FAD-binding protein [candidate division TA06 bacterium DG_26]
MAKNTDVLVIGAGLAGMEASLLLANAGRKVYLVERESYFGGAVIKSEEVFPNMECATCMLAPKQSEVLESKNIDLMTLSEITDVHGEAGSFTVKILKHARYVSLVNCIGCGECFGPCPVSIDNEFEERMSKRKAIYLPCAGALPNAPAIDMEYCVRAKGRECEVCKEACMFDAINFEDKDEEVNIEVGAIIVATGFRLSDASQFSQYGFGKFKNVFHAFEFERLRASNGPTEGAILARDGKEPQSIGLVHCVGRDTRGYCSQFCCMYLTKFAHYAFDKLPGVKVYQFYRELSIPGKGNQKFHKKVKEKGVASIRVKEIEVTQNGSSSGLKIVYQNEMARKESIDVDMVVLAPPVEPDPETNKLAKLLNVELDDFGFFKSAGFNPAETTRPGIFVAGCAEGPKYMQDVVAQAEVAAGMAINSAEE